VHHRKSTATAASTRPEAPPPSVQVGAALHVAPLIASQPVYSLAPKTSPPV
jgi:hypothetical protein